ncbi:MAG: hypothetical protein ACOCWJ_01945 [Verrucomicrobiota bacterium]
MTRSLILRATLFASLWGLVAGIGDYASGNDDAETATAPSSASEQITIPPAVLRRLNTHFPDDPHERILDFYREHGAHFLLELDSRCIESPKLGADYFAELRARWERLQSAKKQNAEDYNHLLSVLHGQNQCIGLARQIRHIRKTIEERGRRGELGERLLYLEKTLMEQLADVFADIQQHHLIELRRLQSELLELRRLIRQRDVNRETIIQSQFDKLVDQ